MAKDKIDIFLDVIETDAQLVQKMLLEIAAQVNARVRKKLPNINVRVRNDIFNYLTTTTIYQSLLNGDLAGEFGLPAVGRRDRLDNIIQAVVDRMEIDFDTYRPVSKKYRGGINFRILLNDLSEILTLIEATVVTEKGEILNWLEWLLTFGDRLIISEFFVYLKDGKGRSRKAIMLPNDARSWSVPIDVAGTINDNWLTRALAGNGGAAPFVSIIERVVEDELRV
jgi:hypothetical protein